MNNALPVHFFTIVLNGMPFIRYHIDVFGKLPFRWHWHIIEGVADLVRDTAWSLRNGGKIADNLHKEGRSDDGTTQYLDALAAKYPGSITVYRKPSKVFWHGKLEMVQRPLSNIQEECLLWQIDVDELWTAEQLTKGHALFLKHPGKTAAFYYCSFFVGPELVVTTLDTYGNYSRSEWLRTWHFMPGDCWQSHEPPQLVRKSASGKTFDVGRANPFKHAETSGNGLIFQHYAYATEPQARFKQDYYGYGDAVAQWKVLQSQKQFPVKLKEYFSWVNDEAVVDRAAEQDIIPLINLNTTRAVHEIKDITTAENILWLRTDAIGDNILASSMLPHLRRHAPRAKIHIVCQEHIAELYDHCPYADTVQVIPKEHRWKDENEINAFIGQLRALKPDLLINSVYSIHALSDLPRLDFVRRRVAMRPSNLINYNTFIETPVGNISELERHRLFLNGLGIEAGEPLGPMLWLSEEDVGFAKELFDKNGLDPSNSIALFTGARTGMKQYSRWSEVLSYLHEKNEVAIVYLGGEAEYAFGEELRQTVPIKFVNVGGQVGLRRAAAILKMVRLAVGVDTALAHMACAMQTNNVILLGGGHFGRFLPYSPQTSIVCQPLSCYGCDWNCRFDKNHCIESISPRTIAYAVQIAFQAQGDKSRIYVDRSVDKQDIIPARRLEYYGRWIDAHKHRVIEVTDDDFTNSHAKNNSAQSTSHPKLPRNLPLISIITPSFNQVSYLEACIRSVIEQDYPNIQYIVMDGGSTDGSREIVEKYAHHLYYWQSQPDNGHYWAVQEGIRRSTGEIVTWLNSDDQFHPHAFKIAVSIFMQRPDIAWITGRPNNINADGTKFSQKAVLPVWSRQKFLDRQYHRPFIQQEGTFWRRSLWDQAGGKLQTQLSLAGDMELWTRFFRHTALHSVDYNFAAYRTHGDNRALLFMDRYLNEAELVIDQELKMLQESTWPRLEPAPTPITKKQIAAFLVESGLHPTATSEKERPPRAALSVTLSPIKLSQSQLGNAPSITTTGKMEAIDISLILPTKDRAQGLDDVLRSLPAAMGDCTYEIILYADREDNEQIRESIGRYGIRKVFYDQEVFGPREGFSWSKLMNHAFAQAAGAWIMYASDDIVFYPDCFSHALSSIEKIADPAIAGIAFLHRNMVETHGGAFEHFGYDSINGDKHYINFGLISAQAFKKTDGFDENLRFFWADVDICLQLWRNGYRIVPSQQSLVDHHNFLEKEQQEKRHRLFALDTARFLGKWKASALFADRNPLQKVRYFLGAGESRQIIESLHSIKENSLNRGKDRALHIVIDGVIFQLQHRRPLGIARVWLNLLPELVKALPQARFTVLERRGFSVPFHNLPCHRVEPYILGDEKVLDKDDEMLRRMCVELHADLFVSTYFTRAPGVPNILLVHDLIPELMGHDMTQPEWRSKSRALETADGMATVSQCTLNDLKNLYPYTARRPFQKMHLGIDQSFGRVAESRLAKLRARYPLPENYLLMVGNRLQYKNSAAMWVCMQDGRWDSQVHVLCVGGEKNLTAEERQLVQAGRVHFITRLEDEELAAAYAGASALVCLSRYEGFGLPVLEAMACGCPVIVSANGSLPEVAGEAALFVDADNSYELLKVIEAVRQPEIRCDLIAKGYARANRFNWQNAGGAMTALIHQVRSQPPPLVSAIVSAYNSERFIRGCLEDLLAQTIGDRLEIIVIDSASAQNEGSVVREFQARCPRIKYVRTLARESVYGAWNRGIKLAKSKYVTNANTDDRHRPDAFEKMVAVLEADSKAALVYADVIKTVTPNQTVAACTPTGVLRWFDWRRERLLTQGCFMGPQPMWRRNVHDVFGFFDERMTVAADYEFWLRISQTFDFRHIAEPLGLYLERADSVEHAHRQKKRAEEHTIHERYSHATAIGKIFDFAPFETLRRAMQCGDPMGMQRAVKDIQRVALSASDAVATDVDALCSDLSTLLKSDVVVSEDRLEGFIQRASHYFLTRGAALYEDAKQVNDREANSEKQKVDASKALRERSQKGVPMMQLADKIQQGVRCLLNSGHVETAQWVLDKLLADDPGHGPAHHERAMLAHHQGDVNRAGLHFKQAAELAPDNPVFQKSLGDFYHVAQKNADAALVQYRKALALTPNDLETLMITGHLCTASHRFDEARSFYQKVLRLAPDHGDARQMLLQLSMKQAAPQPTVSPEELYQSACRQVAQGQRQEAARTLERVIAVDPRHASAHNDLAVLAFEGGDKDKAQRFYEKACELAPYNGVFQKNLGDFYYLERGDAEKALSRYVQALTLDPQDVESLMGTGHICMALGRLDDARVFFNRALALEPGHAEAQQCLQQLDAASASSGAATPSRDLYAVAQSQATAGDPRGAIQTLEQLVGREPNHAQAYNDLGVLHYEQGDKGQALRFYEQAARLAPHDATFLKNLADFYFVEQGRIQEALRIYIQILESNREDVECLMAAGTICLSLDKSGEARTFFERVLEIDPWHAQARDNLNRIQNESSASYGDYIATLGQKRA